MKCINDRHKRNILTKSAANTSISIQVTLFYVHAIDLQHNAENRTGKAFNVDVFNSTVLAFWVGYAFSLRMGRVNRFERGVYKK